MLFLLQKLQKCFVDFEQLSISMRVSRESFLVNLSFKYMIHHIFSNFLGFISVQWSKKLNVNP